MSSATTAIALVEQALAELPPGVNPYNFLAAFLRRQFYPSQPESFRVQLVLCSALLALNLTLVLVAFFVRIRRRAPLTPFRLLKTPQGALLTPQNQVTYAISQTIWLSLAQAFIWTTIATNIDGGSFKGVVLLRSVSWLPLWYTGMTEAWATCVMDLQSHGNGRVAFWRSPLFTNLFFPGLALVGSVAVGVLFHLAESSFDRALSSAGSVERDLLELAQTWDGQQISLATLEPLLPIAAGMTSAFKTFFDWFRDGWIVFAVCAFTPLFVFVPAAVSYHRLLASQIRTIRRNNRVVPMTDVRGAPSTIAGDSVAAVETQPIQATVERKTRKNLETALWRLVSTSATIVTLTAFYTGIAIYIALEPWRVLHTVEGVQVQALAGMYPMATLGTVVSGLSVIRSLQSPSRRGNATQSRSRSTDLSSGRTKRGTLTRQQLGLRVSIPPSPGGDVIHIKSGSGSPTSTFKSTSPTGSFANLRLANVDRFSPPVAVPTLPRAYVTVTKTMETSVSSPESARTASVSRVPVPPMFPSHQATPSQPATAPLPRYHRQPSTFEKFRPV